MDFRYPLHVVTPTLDGDVLTVLAGADEGFSGRQIHRLVSRGSEQGIRQAAERLVEQGVVLRSEIGRAKIYRLNREHVAALYIEGLASARTDVVKRLRTAVETWQIPPRLALLFGSVAQGKAEPSSDLDLFLVRADDVDEELQGWVEQLGALERDATEWTGNDARIVEFGEAELVNGDLDGVVEDALSTGIDIYGSRRRFRRLIAARKQA